MRQKMIWKASPSQLLLFQRALHSGCQLVTLLLLGSGLLTVLKDGLEGLTELSCMTTAAASLHTLGLSRVFPAIG